VLILSHFLAGDTIENRGDVRFFSWAGPIDALRTFPVVVFAYTCHQNVSFYLRRIFLTTCGLNLLSDVFNRE
jgi:amino acid permease